MLAIALDLLDILDVCPEYASSSDPPFTRLTHYVTLRGTLGERTLYDTSSGFQYKESDLWQTGKANSTSYCVN
jgi:hypothetical protein